jgi:hypothetical protein
MSFNEVYVFSKRDCKLAGNFFFIKQDLLPNPHEVHGIVYLPCKGLKKKSDTGIV